MPAARGVVGGGSVSMSESSQILGAIEHTRLQAEVTPAHVEQLCQEARQHRFAGVCVNPIHVPRAAALLKNSSVRVVTVVGFPLGANSQASDTHEAAWALQHGAEEVDMVIPIGLALAGQLEAVTERVAAVRRATQGAVLKVIIECGHFQGERLREVARAARDAEPDYLKTATGFGPRGATVADVVLLREIAGVDIGVKASGGIRTAEDARRLLAAGAVRLGTSSGLTIARELERDVTF